MRTEKLELDKDSGTNTLVAMFSRRFLGLSAAGLFGIHRIPSHYRASCQDRTTVQTLHGC